MNNLKKFESGLPFGNEALITLSLTPSIRKDPLCKKKIYLRNGSPQMIHTAC